MRFFYTTILFFLASLIAFAGAKINPAGMYRLFEYETSLNASPASRASLDVNENAIVTLRNGEDQSVFASRGLEVVCQLTDNIYVVSIPLSKMRQVADLSEVKRISFAQYATPCLDIAREACGVDAVQLGTGLNQAYNGEGILAAVFDVGIDPNHPSFMNWDNKTTRVAVFKNWNTIQSYSGEQVKKATTDTEDATHGTHTSAIFGGSTGIKGTSKDSGQSWINSTGNRATVRPMNATYPFLYTGVAPKTTLYLSGGRLTMSNILAGCREMVNYGVANNMPVVLNLSIGILPGPHDGTSDYNVVLEELGKNAIICISAGNSGDAPCTVQKTLTSADKSLKTFPKSDGAGQFEFWSSDATPIIPEFALFDLETKTILWSVKMTEEEEEVVTTSNYPGGTDYTHSATFDKYFTESAVQLSKGVDENNNRSNASFYLNLKPVEGNEKVVAMIIVNGVDGQRIDGYVSNDEKMSFTSNDIPGVNDGNPSESINNIACAKNVIAVGSFNSRNSFPVLSPNILGAKSVTVGDISGFSSYGTTFDGRKLPTVCGPGQFIVSAYSSYYTKLHDYTNKSGDASAYVQYNNRTYYWESSQGTSMSSPFVAGTIALWLQANPNLTYSDVIEVIEATSVKDSFVEEGNPMRWGAGKINAMSGIKKILNISGVNSVEMDPELRLVITENGPRCFDIYLAGAKSFKATLHSMSGMTVKSVDASGDSATLDASTLAPGVYVLTVNNEASRHTRKIIVR